MTQSPMKRPPINPVRILVLLAAMAIVVTLGLITSAPTSNWGWTVLGLFFALGYAFQLYDRVAGNTPSPRRERPEPTPVVFHILRLLQFSLDGYRFPAAPDRR